MPLFSVAAAALLLAQGQDLAQTPTAYVVGYSHLDTEWNWNYRYSILSCIPRTLSENFALFEKYPDYVFNWTGAKRYQFMKDYYPDQYAKLKEYVRQGRWVVTGSGWDECDANIPAPESIIRQVLYSNQFFKREFGVVSNNYLIPDVFGFPASLPSTLAHAGLKGMSTCKLSYYPDTSSPIPFNVGRWVGPNGDSIVGALNAQSYHTRATEDLSSSPTLLKRIADQQAKSGLQLDYTYYGMGDEGGSPGEESVRWVETSKQGKGPIKIIAKGADQMFDDLTPAQRAKLPAYQGELLISKHSAGTASSAATMKRWNHRNELLADAAECAAVGAQTLTGTPYPQARITDAWQRFLGGQMHDILPGTSTPSAYPFAWNDQVIALNESADVVRASVGAIARQMDTRSAGQTIVVYNPLSTAREDVVEADLPAANHVFGPDGKEVPAQRIGGKLLFLAKVPALGYAAFSARTGATVKKAPGIRVWADGLENARYRVRVDANGDVVSVYDKRNEREMLSAPARLAFLHQKPTRHPAWNMDWDDQKQPPVGYVDGPAKITIAENGPVRVALRIEREAQGSKFVSFVRLSRNSDRVEFAHTIDWRSSECSLKAVFPLVAKNEKATYDCGIGTVQRGNDWEKLYEGPSQRWFDLTDQKGDYGASVLSEAKYGSDKPDDSTLRLTLLYTPGVGGSYQHQGTGDWGRHEIQYALTGHVGDWRRGRTADEAARLVQPLMPFAVPSHAGRLGKQVSFASLDKPSVAVMAMKKAEESNEVIVRLLERNGNPVQAAHLHLAAPILAAREVDGQERPLPGAAKVAGGELVFDLKGYGVRAFALKLGARPAPDRGHPVRLLTARPEPSLPTDFLPKTVESGGISFSVQPGTLRGQKVNVTGGKRLYILAASTNGDRTATFLVDGKPKPLALQAWNGYVGQWDTRLWEGASEDERTSNWTHKLLGIAPGYIKRAPIAWYADHRQLPDGKKDAYRFTYLYRYAITLPAGAKTVQLPNDPNVIVLAATVGDGAGDEAQPLRPLYDTLAGHPAWKNQ